MKPNSSSRRAFIRKTAAGAIAAAALPNVALLAASSASNAEGEYGGNRIPFGLQLYSVRHDCERDLDGTIMAVGKMGYKAVEFAGYYGRDAKSLRKLLDNAGLKCCGTHLELDALLGDNLWKTVEFNQILGNQFLVVPSFPDQYTKTHDGWLRIADIYSEIAAKVKPRGMRMAYHNEDIEFTPVGGEVPWDIFFNRASKDVLVQFDTANGYAQGGDPMIYLKKKPGRVASIHAKGYSKSKPGALIGEDDLPWKDIFHLCETTAGVEWYIIEYESTAMPPLVAVEKTLATMRRWGKC
jgi:sugar phosphate isomerase/epimerase